MWTDPIVSEIRKIRDAHAARCDFDLSKIIAELKAQEEKSGRIYVNRPAKPAQRRTALSERK